MDEVRKAMIKANQAEKIKRVQDFMKKEGVTIDGRQRLNSETGFIENVAVYLVVEDFKPTAQEDTQAPAALIKEAETKPEEPQNV